jgi:hypothetical protein
VPTTNSRLKSPCLCLLSSLLKSQSLRLRTCRESEKDKELNKTVEHHLGNHRDCKEVSYNSRELESLYVFRVLMVVVVGRWSLVQGSLFCEHPRSRFVEKKKNEAVKRLPSLYSSYPSCGLFY